jgi:hypothetical protein
VIGQSCSTRLPRMQTYQSYRVAMTGDQAELVAEPEAVGGGRDGEPAVLAGGALVGRGGLVADERRGRNRRRAP